MLNTTANHLNTIGNFCGMRDIPFLTGECLQNTFHIPQADIMVLFGGSILAGGDVLADAMKNRIAKKYIIVGGAGHTTDALRKLMQPFLPGLDTSSACEAELFAAYIKYRYHLEPDLLECQSTNCGNNITYLLELLKKHHIPYKSIILTQDATMQRRMDAGFRKYVSPDTLLINYAAYHAKVVADYDRLTFASPIHGMWNMERYITLLMGEIPRLLDTENGYGPNGADYIAHVDIPKAVLDAFEALRQDYASLIREANPLYASAPQT